MKSFRSLLLPVILHVTTRYAMAVTHASPSINGRPASATGVNDFVASLGLPHAKAEKVVEALTLVDPTAALHSTQNGTDTAKRGEAACNVAQIVLGSSTLSNRTEITPVIEETWLASARKRHMFTTC
jgi:hypothetical protein